MRWIAIVIAGLALSACQASKPLDQLSYSELKTVADQIGARCEAQGITRKSPEWGLCVQQETNREDATRKAASTRRHRSVYCTTNNWAPNFTTTTCN